MTTSEDYNLDPFADLDTEHTFGLFDTVLSDELSDQLRSGLSAQRQHIDAPNLRYAVLPPNIPQLFDPRDTTTIPPQDVKKWFFKDENGKQNSILCIPLDQAGCGSCWAFSTATQFTDVIRFNLLSRYGENACVGSVFFHPTFVCTGDSQLTTTTGGVVNENKVSVYAQESRMQISTYFTVAFSPKFSARLQNIDRRCNDALTEWKSAIGSANRTARQLSKDYSDCIGCGGNLIICPLMMFTGSTEAPGVAAGAPIAVDFPLHEWACLWGNDSVRKRFCSEEFLAGTLLLDFPKLYKADAYSYVDAKTFAQPTKRVQGINSMIDWMQAAIYNYGPVTIGFSVYSSFLQFFTVPGNAKKIYTADVLMQQVSKERAARKQTKALGGHAVVVVGWAGGGTSSDPPYWIVRNSWGTKWGDGGYFKVERGIDAKLAKAGLPEDVRMKFESEFGNLYFAPGPNAELYENSEGGDKVNDMKNFLLSIPRARCPALGEHPSLLALMNRDCKCRCGTAHDPNALSAPDGCAPVSIENSQSLPTESTATTTITTPIPSSQQETENFIPIPQSSKLEFVPPTVPLSMNGPTGATSATGANQLDGSHTFTTSTNTTSTSVTTPMAGAGANSNAITSTSSTASVLSRESANANANESRKSWSWANIILLILGAMLILAAVVAFIKQKDVGGWNSNSNSNSNFGSSSTNINTDSARTFSTATGTFSVPQYRQRQYFTHE